MHAACSTTFGQECTSCNESTCTTCQFGHFVDSATRTCTSCTRTKSSSHVLQGDTCQREECCCCMRCNGCGAIPATVKRGRINQIFGLLTYVLWLDTSGTPLCPFPTLSGASQPTSLTANNVFQHINHQCSLLQRLRLYVLGVHNRRWLHRL